MPAALSSIEELQTYTKLEPLCLRKLLDSLCHQQALKLIKRKKRVLHPETIFEKAILKHLQGRT